MLIVLLICISIIGTIKCSEEFRIHSVNITDGSQSMSIIGRKIRNDYIFKYTPGFGTNNSIASAFFIEQINSTGWGHLLVKSSVQYSDELQAYYAGVVESLITRKLIAAHWYNTIQGYCAKPNAYCKSLADYLKQNFLSVVDKTRNENGFLKMLRLHLWQIKGIQDGYDGNWKSNSSEINEKYLLTMQDQLFHLFLLQIEAELSTLSSILGGSKYHSKFTGFDPKADARCSALIKYIKGTIFSAHVTWHGYNSMLRITKLYNFPFRVNANERSSPLIPGTKMSFSSYPGVTLSMDDFYITSSGLTVSETTISNYNDSLYVPLKTMASEIVLEYSRVQASNRLATSGEQWAKLYANNNSGTYNNQWMIVDNKLMKNHIYGDKIPNGVLYVVEQIPSLVVYEDVTDYLRTASYWPSYNIPYNKTIWQLGNFQSTVDTFGDLFDYNKSPRALIFKRNVSSVIDDISLMRLMRYNNYKHDPLSKCACNPPYSATNAISARFDLNQPNGTYPCKLLGYALLGGYDMKYTTSVMAPSMKFIGISGPTYDQQPVFDWNNIHSSSAKHRMQPERFRFPPVLTPFS